jgi:hypothetical protein
MIRPYARCTETYFADAPVDGQLNFNMPFSLSILFVLSPLRWYYRVESRFRLPPSIAIVDFWVVVGSGWWMMEMLVMVMAKDRRLELLPSNLFSVSFVPYAVRTC